MLLVREVLGGDPDEKQEEILIAVCAGERRISVRSGHGVGKTTVLAWCAVCHALTRFPQRVVCTAPTSTQLFDALAADIKKCFKALPTALLPLFQIQTEQIFHSGSPEESYISFRTSRPETPEAMAGIHSDNVLLICDEASGIPEAVYEAGIGSMSGHNATTLLAGNPVRSTGLFYKTHHELRDLWRTIHISCVGHRRIAPDFVAEAARRYGEKSNAYRVRVLGDFPLADGDTIIPFELMESALKRDVKPLLVREVWGVDCARFGDDNSALARRKGNTLVCPVEEKSGYDTMQVTGWVKAKWDATPPSERPAEIMVDVIGIGAGVTDRLMELGLPVRGINVSEAPSVFDERYTNLRTELWFKGKEWLAALDCSLGGDEKLGAELIGPKYRFSSSGKFQAETKEEMKKRGLGSPNRADAFLMTLASEAAIAMHGGEPLVRASWKTALKRPIKGIV